MSSTLPPLPAAVLLRRVMPDDFRYGDIYGHTDAAMRAYGEACAAAERERIIRIIEAYKVPVGNSRSGELAAEWTMDALRDIRAAIRARGET